jgi:glutathione S-transferase
MQLIGYMDSPFVRRVAVSARMLGIQYEHRELSIFRDFEEFSSINPLVKVPTVICDDGQVLVDSQLIIDYFESVSGDNRLMPSDEANYIRALSVIGTAMVANEKTVQLIYELATRPAELQHQEWIDRVQLQLTGAIDLLEKQYDDVSEWMFGDEISQADITAAITWKFTQFRYPERVLATNYPALAGLSARAEALPEFVACAIEP